MSVAKESLNPAETALIAALQEAGGEGKPDDLFTLVRQKDPRITEEELRAAIWSLASRGIIELNWQGQLVTA